MPSARPLTRRQEEASTASGQREPEIVMHVSPSPVQAKRKARKIEPDRQVQEELCRAK